MVFKIGKHFNATARQNFFNFDSLGLIWTAKVDQNLVADMEFRARALRAYNSLRDIAYGYICGANPILVGAASNTIRYYAQLSLEKEDWRPYTRPLNEKELRQQYYLDVGKVFDRSFEARPDLWIDAQLVLNFLDWLETGHMDYPAIQDMFNTVIDGVKMYDGEGWVTDLMAMSAWPQLLHNKMRLEENRKKIPKNATHAIGHTLAADPEQLHDPKSPIRKRARTYMRGNMSQNWLAQGDAALAADWLRTFEWREGESGLSPREVMLRAYAYMPEVEPPPNIATEVAQLRKIPI